MTRQDIVVVRESIEKIVSMLTLKAIKVTQRGSKAYVEYDKKTGAIKSMNIPYLPDDASPEFVAAIQGFVDHEVGHVLFSSSSTLKKAHKAGKRVANMANIVEDVFIESRMLKQFAGSSTTLNAVRSFYLNSLAKPKIEEALKAGDVRRAQAYAFVIQFRAWGGQKIASDFLKDNPEIAKLNDEMIEKVGDLSEQLSSIKSSDEALNLAIKIVERLKETKPPEEPAPSPPPPLPSPDGDGDSDESDDGDSDDGADAVKGSTPAEPESEPEGEPEAETPSAAAPEEGDESDEPAAEEPTPEPTPEPAPEPEADPADDDLGDAEPRDPIPGGDDAAPDDESVDDAADDGAAAPPDDESGDGASEAPPVSAGADDGDDMPDVDDFADGDSGTEASDGADSPGTSADDLDAPTGGDSPTASSEESDEPDGLGDTDLTDVLDEHEDFDDALADALSKRAAEETSSSDYAIFSTDWDVVEPGRQCSSPDSVEEMVGAVRHMVSPLQKSLERAMVAKARKTWNPGQRRGRINPGALFRTSVGDDKIFRTRYETRAKNTAVSLLVDCSGSMLGGGRIATAAKAAYALSETLERLRITHEVIGFTTRASSEMNACIRAERSGVQYAREEALYMPVFKGFSERLTSEAKSRIAFLTEPGVRNMLRENVDGECVQVAARRLMTQKAERHVLLVLSDGNPACPGDYRALRRHLKSVVPKIEAAGVEVLGIGIQTDCVKDFYDKSVVLRDLAELPVQVMSELQKILLAA